MHASATTCGRLLHSFMVLPRIVDRADISLLVTPCSCSNRFVGGPLVLWQMATGAQKQHLSDSQNEENATGVTRTAANQKAFYLGLLPILAKKCFVSVISVKKKSLAVG